MEVRLGPAENQAVPEDCFISVRVGDVQKQSRLGAGRSYRFPDPGDGRRGHGRVEVFKRVGYTVVSFDSLTGEVQPVDVPTSLPELSTLTLSLAVTSTEGKPMEAVAEKKGKAKARADAAAKYLSEHRLEEVLAEAMREVIGGKPQDPFAFLAAKLQAKSRGPLPPAPLLSAKAPPEDTAPLVYPMQETVVPRSGFGECSFGTYYAAHFSVEIRPGALAGLHGKFPRPAVVAPAARLPAAMPAKFGEYYGQHFSVACSMPAGLYAKFPAPKAALEKAAPAATLRGSTLATARWSEYYGEHMLPCLQQSALTGLYAKFSSPKAVPAKAAAPQGSTLTSARWSEYYGEHLLPGLQQRALAGLYAKFPRPAAWATTVAPAKASPTLAAPFKDYYSAHMLQSPLPESLFRNFGSRKTAEVRKTSKTVVRAAIEAAATVPVAAPAVAAAVAPFARLPSVGSWLAVRPPAVRVAGAAPAAAAMRSFALKPSVGTWYTPLPPSAAVTQEADHAVVVAGGGGQSGRGRFEHLPSVGSWLAPAPRSGESPASVASTSVATTAATAATPAAAARAQADVPFQMKPSVGSWLALAPKRTPAAKERSLLLRSRSDLEKMDKTELVHEFRHELAAKDEEIAALRRLLAERQTGRS